MKIRVVLAASLLATLAACGGDSDTVPSPSDTATDTVAPTGTTVTLLAYDSFTPSEGIFDSFTAETGIEVEVVTGGDAGELVAKAALTAGDPEGDVLWGVDNTLMSRAIEAGVFGVPTALVDGELFWGVDATDMLLGYVAEDPFFRSEAYALAHALPAAVHRKK